MSSMKLQRETIIANATIDFHTATMPFVKGQDENKENKTPIVFSIFPDTPEMKFGILEITIASTPVLSNEQVIDASIDVSGSMADMCKDGKSKNDHIKHTIINIVKSITKETDANITLGITSFDHTITEVLPDTKINSENFDFIKLNIQDLEPNGSTNINLAISKQTTRTEKRQALSIETMCPIIHTNITLTDGLANIGETNLTKISKYISPISNNIFIGYGKDHDATGLQLLADSTPNGKYYYIDAVEEGYLIFGEILNSILFGALQNITFEIENGEIYNYKTNTWSSTLTIDTLTSEVIKQFHLKSINPRNVVVKIFAASIIHGETEASLILDDIDEIPALTNEDTDEPELKDLSVYLLRQKTQELMFKAHYQNISSNTNINAYNNQINQQREQLLRTEINDLSTFMQCYLDQNPQNKKDEEKIQGLIEDMQVILKTIGSLKASMYSSARSNSQGEQRAYNMGSIDPADLYENRRKRFNTHPLNQHQHQHQHQHFNPTFASPDINDMPIRHLTQSNTTPRQLTLMRELSAGHSNVVDDLQEE